MINSCFHADINLFDARRIRDLLYRRWHRRFLETFVYLMVKNSFEKWTKIWRIEDHHNLPILNSLGNCI